jgi:carbon monoxide dehydrogenase subunit G
MTDVNSQVTPLRVRAQVHVRAGQEQVWALVTDWSRQHEWIWATRVRGGQGLGATVVGWTGVGPVGFTDTMIISEWEPPRRCVVRHTGRVVRGSGIFEVIPDGTECDFRWTEDLELPLPPELGRLAGLVIRPIAGWSLAASLRRFARLL